MLTRKQHELLCLINDRHAETGVSPSFEEMKEALGLKSKSGVHRLVSALEERGFIKRLANRARALEIVKLPDGGMRKDDNVVQLRRPVAKPMVAPPRPANDVIEVPLRGRIAAGLPIEAIEEHASLPVPAALLGPGEHYALQVEGDSMIEAGILSGDYALILKVDSAREGEIVVALIDEHEATLKYFRHQGSMVRLDPANATMEPQVYAANQVRVQGRLAGLLRRYH